MTTKFHDANRASEILAKIGRGAADADFARAFHEAIDRAQQTMKKCKVVTTVEVEPDEERGCLLVRVDIVAKLAKLPVPASQMHVGPGGGLLTQQEWLMGGGRDEAPLSAKPQPVEGQAASPSGRFKVVQPPAPAPVAAAPTPKPMVGKDAAAGEQA